MNLRVRKPKPSGIDRGDRVKDKISGFMGIVTTKTVFIAGCERIGVQAEKLENGKPIETQYFDSPNLDVVEKGAVKITNVTTGTKIKLGDRIKHKVNGLVGVVTSETTSIAAPRVLGVTPEALDKEGKPQEPLGFEEHMVEICKKSAKKTRKADNHGGDQKVPRTFM